MGKIVKFCGSCEEGFAEKFGFCPNCGQSLQTFEMKQVISEAPPVVEAAIPETVIAAPVAVEPVKYFEPRFIEKPVTATPIDPEPVYEEPVMAQPVEPEAAIAEPVAELPQIIEPVAAAVTNVTAPANTYVRKPVAPARRKPVLLEARYKATADDGGFHVTVIEEKNVGQRRALLAGALGLVVFSLMSGMVYNLFSKDLEVGSINDDIFNAVIVDDIPTIEEKVPIPKDKDKGGGGGGGGNNDPNPASQGERAPMRTDPQFAPSVSMDRVTQPTIPIQMAIKGPINENKINVDKYGVKLGGDTPSDGSGSGGGQGSGRNGGQGGGNGPGYGPGNNGGLGGGNNGGIGPGNGPGGDGIPPPPVRPVGITQGIKIVSKPRPGYTDAARTANVQGTVLLRVVFLANGQVGSVSSVKGLPNGLTEQAIAAAKRIVFEPAKNNGIAQSVTKQIEYSFSIY